MRIAWAGAFVGLFISYFLAEAGDRLYDGNFLWTGQMAVFVLFVAAAAFLFNRLTKSALGAATLGRGLVTMAVLWLHVESGLRHVHVKVEPSRWLAFWT
jgi:nitrate reductase gamma subunit